MLLYKKNCCSWLSVRPSYNVLFYFTTCFSSYWAIIREINIRDHTHMWVYDDTGKHHICISLYTRYSGFRYDICYNFILNSLLLTVYKEISLKLKIQTHKMCNIKDTQYVMLSNVTVCTHTYTGCFTTLGHNCRRWFPRSLWSKKFI